MVIRFVRSNENQPFFQKFDDLASHDTGVERFGYIRVEAAVHDALFVRRIGISRYGDDRYPFRKFADFCRRFVAVQYRHVDVHQYQVGLVGFEQFHGFPAVPRMQDRVVFFQDCFE